MVDITIAMDCNKILQSYQVEIVQKLNRDHRTVKNEIVNIGKIKLQKNNKKKLIFKNFYKNRFVKN